MATPMEHLVSLENFHCRFRKLSLENNTKDWLTLLGDLQHATAYLKEELNRGKTTEDFFNDIGVIVMTASRLLCEVAICEQTSVIQATTECYRCLRSACADNPRNQRMISQQTAILESTLKICKRLVAFVCDHDYAVLLRCAVQFIGNFAVGNVNHQKFVWEKFSSSLRDLVQSSDAKLPQYSCMVLHTCLSGYCCHADDIVISALSSDEGKSLVIAVLDVFQTTDSEWALFCIEDVLKLNNIWANLSSSLSVQQRLLLLEIMLKQLKDEDEKRIETDSDQSVAMGNVTGVAADFNKLAHTVLQLNIGEQENLEPLVVVKFLEVLCRATASPDQYPDLRDNEELVKSCMCLLRGIHEIGRTGENMFSSVQKLSQAGAVDSDHPSHGLKRDLVRLIGNMTYKHRANQDLVRQLEGIPLILDQTNIDERNPYITQWAVFAIHNLCEENQENMAILAGLRREGLADNVDLLQDFGVQAEIKDDKIIVKPPSNSSGS